MLLYYDNAGKAEMTTSTGAVYYTNNAGLNWKAQVLTYCVHTTYNDIYQLACCTHLCILCKLVIYAGVLKLQTAFCCSVNAQNGHTSCLECYDLVRIKLDPCAVCTCISTRMSH
jgi:Photosynthesis system II assembly factor YCF48